MIEIKDILLVKAIAEHGTLVRAARVLGVSQPNLTRNLSILETKLNGQLFERRRHGVIATNLARTILADAPDILEKVEHLERSLEYIRGDHEAEIQVATGALAGETIAYRAAALMTARNPKLQIKIFPGDWKNLPRTLQAREASLGILDKRGHEDEPNFFIEPFLPQPGIIVVRNGHPLTIQKKISLTDIFAFPLFMIDRLVQQAQGPVIRAREDARLAGNAYPAFPAMVFYSPTAALEQLRHCDAVMGITPQIGGAALRGGEVVALRWREPWLSFHPACIIRRGYKLSDGELAFIDALHETSRLIEEESRAWFENFGLSRDCF